MEPTKTPAIITVNAKLLAIAQTFAAKKDVRYYLKGVRIEPAPGGGVLIVATDGAALICLHDVAGSATAPAITPLVKIQPAEQKGKAAVTFDGARAFFASGASAPAEYVDGRYPDWRRIIPEQWQPSMEPAAFDGDLIAKFRTVAALHQSRDVVLNQCGEKAALVTFGDGVPAFGVIMPLRSRKIQQSVPFSI